MDYVCTQLSQPTADGVQTCLQWSEQSYVPPLSDADRDVILAWIFSIFALVWGIRRVFRLFGH
ncbi:hypothetical protein J8Z72_04195 [Acinetobacter nosocomialis]|jgi:hypothetical protein|uniref:hypothetical protein n=1 Tax=Acinetobacter calcoaceticus/baumannii complex TaxID=909768 RepID=UPI000D0B1280|nr:MULTISPECIES: hypothetical protein [Acinetobacter calcoaceticus/baumannii complex]MBP1511052.1 hypothetical protein [Acinetobacter nosocomialis]MBP1515424.1 hypothetical protein [Acinetobacter nosocomialis]PSD92018.1 hypothetical protein C7G76_17505 [Acinetobacter baumannii]